MSQLSGSELLAGGLVSLEDARSRVRMSRSAFYSAMGRGEIGFVKAGRHRLIPLAALEAFVERNYFPARERSA
jgi:excisionase family DNA binding protein